jgi:hypothetical protein
MNFLYPIDNYKDSGRIFKNKFESEVRYRHMRVMTRVIEDWMHDNWELPGGHPLIKILNNLNAVTDDDYRAFLLLREQVGSLAGALGFFGGTDKGRLLDKPWFFLDPNTPECVISSQFEDTQKLILEQTMHEDKNYWMSWEPIRVRYHVYTDMDYWIMGKDYGNEPRVPCDKDGINIIEIDMALLYMQYRYWRKSRYSKATDNEGNTYEYPRTVFLTRFALANAIDSQMQVAYLNRVRCYFMGTPLGSSRPINKRHAYINTYMNVDNSILNSIMYMKKYGGLDFDKIVSNFPTIAGNSYGNFFKELDIRLDQRTELICCYSVLPLYEVWLNLVNEKQMQRWNRNEIQHVSRGLFLINNRKLFSTVSSKFGNRLQLRFSKLAELLPKIK